MRKYNINKILITILLVILGGSFALLKTAWAEENIASSLFVSPMSQELLLIPGETYTGTIKISNSASARENLYYSAKIGSYGTARGEDDPDDYSGGTDVVTKGARNEIMDWITIDKENGEVEPNGVDQINYTISVPDNAPAGAQYASILVIKDTVTEGSSNEDGVAIQNVYQIASAIIANIAGETIEKASITENNIPTFLTANPLKTNSLVKNEGNIYTKAEYILQVWPLFGDEEICTNEENPESSLVLPETERYHAQSCDLPSVGIFRAKQTVKIFGEESTVEKLVIVCPIWLLFLIIFVIIALIIWIVMRIRARGKASKKSTTRDTE